MEIDIARNVIGQLSQGIHPVSGKRMPPESPYLEPLVIGALHAAAQALEARPRKASPPNAGKAWAPGDDDKIGAAFAAGLDFKAIAQEIGRTSFAVQSRLVKLGHLPPQPGMRV